MVHRYQNILYWFEILYLWKFTIYFKPKWAFLLCNFIKSFRGHVQIWRTKWNSVQTRKNYNKLNITFVQKIKLLFIACFVFICKKSIWRCETNLWSAILNTYQNIILHFFRTFCLHEWLFIAFVCTMYFIIRCLMLKVWWTYIPVWQFKIWLWY